MLRRFAAVSSVLIAGALMGAPPAQATIFSDWSSVSAGETHTCGIRSGMLHCWGDNTNGRLGDGTTSQSLTPKRITQVSDWKSVNTGVNHTCAIRGTGALYCWGGNTFGQVGDGTSGTDRLIPKRITMVSDWKVVSSGGVHTCAIRGTGALYCWGNNDSGRLGDGTTTEHHSPTRIGTAADWKTVSAGNSHTCGIRGTGQLYCWGFNGTSQLGDGTADERHSPKRIASGVSDWRTINAGYNHTCAIRGGGALYCWGFNFFGQIGDGTFGASATRTVPKRIMSAVSDGKAISAGADHTCGIRGAGTLYCWGFGGNGRLGTGNTTDQHAPKQITNVFDWKTVSAGQSHTCAIRDGGALYCWGNNGNGRLGDGTTTERLSPKRI